MRSTAFRLFLFSFLVGPLCIAAANPGDGAPAFSLPGNDGQIHTLKENSGKWVVLEWLNHGCPFVRKHYDGKNMQALQGKYTDKGVVWYSIISSAKGKQGYATAEEANADIKKYAAKPTAVLFDAEGTVGKLYGAETTPHLFVINPAGKIVFMGGIDNRPTSEISDIKGATNYVAAALDAGLAGMPVKTAKAKPYGCSIKYK